MANISVLAAFAHPDDEGFGPGGTLAMLADRGAALTLICATNGDVGEISDPVLATTETLAQVRQEELRAAMAVTGVQDVRFLGYRDSGMQGTPDNNDPSSLYQAPAEQVTRRLVDIIRELRPDVVMTHDPTGGYGHPDHVTVYQRVTEAFEMASDPEWRQAGQAVNPEPWSPGLLYYVCFPRSNFQRLWRYMVDNGIEPPFASLEADKIGSPDEAVTTSVDVSAYVETKLASLACHRTQMNAQGAFAQLPEELTREIMSTEYFTLAVSQGGSAGVDLLANLG
ncbi:MAG: hypothetical protein BZY88_20100 [SAR202 cluster bacterium Io17-Chloro-G9]|nr:MAG: hypothetical protein BZY88_20100 [SAR202 cluster bacterium Io17-Chloro-G9]